MDLWDTVQSITYERTDEYFDLHVPGAEHYLAEGLWHHNTGKTRAALEKLHLCAEKYPGMRGLIVRKTRVSLSESALVTWESNVVPDGHPILEGASRSTRRAYQYPNGSSIVIAGLDRPTRIMSTEFDLAFVQEGIELSENEWEAVTTRLRNGKMPYQQIIGDTNPDRPGHWLKKRADAGRIVLLESRHEDNPVMYDGENWTERGLVYLSKLDALTGPRKARLRYGRWVQAEGVVYDNWDAQVHVIDRFDIPKTWARYWVVDFGFTNPFVMQWWAQDQDGRLYLYREIYLTHRLVEDHAKHALQLCGASVKNGQLVWPLDAPEPRPRAIICDHDAEDRATLERHLRMPTMPAKKNISAGIQAVAARLRKAGDKKPRLFVLRDSLVERDPALVDAKLPIGLTEEIDAYIWETSGGRKVGEEPVDKDNHAMDCLRYIVSHWDLQGGPTSRPQVIGKGPNVMNPFRSS